MSFLGHFDCGTGASAGVDAHTADTQWASESGIAVHVAGRPLGRRPESRTAAAILSSYLSSGDAFLDSLDGEFCVAILDNRKQRAVVAVDRMGIGKVAYTVLADTLIYGSSAEDVARFGSRSPRLDPQAIFDYLMLHMVPAPGTVFAGVRKLRPGHSVVFENGVAREDRYWKPRFTETGGDFESLRRDLHESLRSAVRACEPSERSGAFLSGGLDSSTVAGVLSEIGPPPARTFSIGFGYPQYDELSYARLANDRFGCRAHEYVVTGDDIADGFPLIARAYDEPFGNSSALPVYFCARMARENGVDHLLAGDGGDELFAGNSRYAEQEIFERYRRLPALLRAGLIEPVLSAWPDTFANTIVRKGRSYVAKANVPLPARLEAWNLIRLLGPAEVLHPDFRAVVDEHDTLRRMQERWDTAPARSTLGHMLWYDWQYTLSDNDLRKVQTMSALAGVRVSYPMLHPDVIDLSMRVPPGLLMPGRQLRDFYKRAMIGFLPDAIIQKTKHGFGLPFGLWLQETPRLRDQIFDNLAALRSRRLIRADFIERLLHLHGQDDASYYGVFIWVLAMLEQWLRAHDLST